MDETDETDERNESGQFFHEFFHGRIELLTQNRHKQKKEGHPAQKARCPILMPDKPHRANLSLKTFSEVLVTSRLF